MWRTHSRSNGWDDKSGGHRVGGKSVPKGVTSPLDRSRLSVEAARIGGGWNNVDLTMAYVGTRALFEPAGFTVAATTDSGINEFRGRSCGSICADVRATALTWGSAQLLVRAFPPRIRVQPTELRALQVRVRIEAVSDTGIYRADDRMHADFRQHP